jgi:hypothetical protein
MYAGFGGAAGYNAKSSKAAFSRIDALFEEYDLL